MSLRKPWFNIVLLLAIWLLWGYSWTISKLGLPLIGPFDMAVWRTLLGALTLAVLTLATGRSLRPTPFWPTFVLGLAQTALFTALTNFALVAGGAGKVSVLSYTMPFWAALLTRWWLKEPVARSQYLALGCALLGLIGILEPWHLKGSLLSDALALSGGLAWAFAAVHAKRIRRHGEADTLALTFWQMFWGFWPLLLLAGLIDEPPPHWGWPLWGVLLYLGPLASGAGWLIWMTLLARLSASVAGLSVLVIPALALALSALQLGEAPSHAEALGMGLIGLSLALVAWQGMRRSAS
jgi:drug/metabolite transporter (DMT)-like permease